MVNIGCSMDLPSRLETYVIKFVMAWCVSSDVSNDIIQLMHLFFINIIQLMHLFEVNIRICQPENRDVHRGNAKVHITFEG